jgi:hypothetical protein
MFRRGARPTREVAVLPNVHPQAILIADPDTPSITRERALRHQTGRQLQGHSGLVVDYDRGDPAHSIETVMLPRHLPSGAYARLGMADAQRLPTTEIYDAATTDAELSAYQASMLARIAR